MDESEPTPLPIDAGRPAPLAPTPGPADGKAARAQRLAKALRDNLKRRKATRPAKPTN